jgi:hypothetical protein
MVSALLHTRLDEHFAPFIVPTRPSVSGPLVEEVRGEQVVERRENGFDVAF